MLDVIQQLNVSILQNVYMMILYERKFTEMMIKLKVPDFLRDDRVFFVENRLEKGRLLHETLWEPKGLCESANRRFRELGRMAGLMEKEKAEVERLVYRAWKQYRAFYNTGLEYDIRLKMFRCKVIGPFWGREPGAVYYESVPDQKKLWLRAITKRN